MSGKIQLIGGPSATLNEAGEWECQDSHISLLLNRLSEKYPSETHLPDPFATRFLSVIKEVGAHPVEYSPPSSETEDGVVY